MRSSIMWFITLAVLAWSLGTSALGYEPLPWDKQDGFTELDLPGQQYPRVRPGDREMRREPFGTLGMLFEMSTLSGALDTIGDGTGYTIEIPATLPGWIIYGLLMSPTGMMASAGQDAWSSGFRGGGLRTSPLIDELNVDILYSQSRHSDELFGGDIRLTRFGLGVRMSGPAPIDRRVRANVGFGWVLHSYDCEARDNFEAMGPYAVLGLESRVRRMRDDGEMNMYGFRLSGRWDWVKGIAAAERFDAMLFSVGAGFSFYW